MTKAEVQEKLICTTIFPFYRANVKVPVWPLCNEVTKTNEAETDKTLFFSKYSLQPNQPNI